MTTQSEQILHSFDLLPDGDKREVAVEILRRELAVETPPLSDTDLVGIAEQVFLQLDSREGPDAS